VARWIGGRWREITAWVGTVCLLAYLLSTTDLGEAWKAISGARMLILAPAIVVFTLLNFLVDSSTAGVLLRRSGFNVTQREFRRIRGASLILNSLNYALALAMMTTLLSKRSGRGLIAASSPFIMLSLIDLCALSVFVLFVLIVGFCPLGGDARMALALFGAGGLFAGPSIMAASRAQWSSAWLGRLFGNDLTGAFRVVEPVDLGLVAIMRFGYVAMMIGEAFVYLSAFGFTVPFTTLLGLEPIMVMVGVLPVAIAGIGSTQVVARELFGGYAPAGVASIPAVDALTTSVISGVLVMKLLIGLRYLPSAVRAMKKENGERSTVNDRQYTVKAP